MPASPPMPPLPYSPEWEAWRRTSKELAPDFAQLPATALLQDPLIGVQTGERITTPPAWQAERATLKALFSHWLLGQAPPPPQAVHSEILSESQHGNALVRQVRLTFDDKAGASLRLEVFLPTHTPNARYPVFMTQHNHRAWALMALRRGYIAVVYAGSDSQDDTTSFNTAYPDADWSTLTRRAWAASRCVDYLLTLPQVNANHIALTGHSRNGKQALFAAAFDTRITAIALSSAGSGGTAPFRLVGEPFFGEGIEAITRAFPDWFHPRLRFFAGNEDKLPVDMHHMLALVAPRPCLIALAFHDPTGNLLAEQHSVRAVQPLYAWLGNPNGVRITWRHSWHDTWATIIEGYLDWFDAQFGRGVYTLPERTPHLHALPPCTPAPLPPLTGDLSAWASLAQWQAERESVMGRIQAVLGTPPIQVSNILHTTQYGIEQPYVTQMMERGKQPTNIEKQQLVFGEGINADVYLPKQAIVANKRVPLVLWLHPFATTHGYTATYPDGEQVYHELAREGFAVFCFDQIGFGRRNEEAEAFYTRHPNWSLLGKMLHDCHAALDVIETLPYVDGARIWSLGYALGSVLSLYLGAQDTRLKGQMIVAPPQPYRQDTAHARTGGLARWWSQYHLAPAFAQYDGQEASFPFDVAHLIASFAPRPLSVITTQHDRLCEPSAMADTVQQARAIYALHNAPNALTHHALNTYNHWGKTLRAQVQAWLKQALSPKG